MFIHILKFLDNVPGIQNEDVLMNQMGSVREEEFGHHVPYMEREMQGPAPGDGVLGRL